MLSTFLTPLQISRFQRQVKQYYHQNGRHGLLWRLPDQTGGFDPYKILVSEVMLQQTQVGRVTVKYQEFLRVFPNLQTLARGAFPDVLRAWSGLGYNRRAQYLHRAGGLIMRDFGGRIPENTEQLVHLPGIGPNTAAAILTYSFNKPVVFIETNIRTVYLHHFFADEKEVPDSRLLPYIGATLDTKNPRQWYWALMDYGSFLKTSVSNPSRRSRHYSKQSAFEGSRRQIRGKVLKTLLENSRTPEQLKKYIADERLESVLQELAKEGLIRFNARTYSLGK